MKQAIAGVTPSESEEVTIMTVWPSICTYGPGQLLGRLYANQAGVFVLTVGNLLALAFIPVSLVLYFLRVAPFLGVRYKVSNRRVIVLRGIQGTREDKSIGLDRFDEITVEVLPGQAWYHAGDLVFKREGVEHFRLSAVSRPESFRAVCMKAHQSYVGVRRAVAHA